MAWRSKLNRGLKKKFGRKRVKRNTRRIPMSRAMRPQIYLFKRRRTEVVELDTQTPPTGWNSFGNALYKQFVYKLTDLTNYSDFTNLFNQYKLAGVKCQFIFSNTQSAPVQHDSNPTYNPNAQIVMWLAPNPTGKQQTLSPTHFYNTSSATKRICLNGGKPVGVYRRNKQLTQILQAHPPAGGTPTTDYGFSNPKFISTSEPHTEHYGLNVLLERVDGNLMAGNSNNYQYMRIYYTYYVVCRQVE